MGVHYGGSQLGDWFGRPAGALRFSWGGKRGKGSGVFELSSLHRYKCCPLSDWEWEFHFDLARFDFTILSLGMFSLNTGSH